MAARTTSDAAKLVVANMTIFGLAALDGSATWLELGRTLLWTVPGNVIGGGLLVGVAYSWLAGPPQRASRPAGAAAAHVDVALDDELAAPTLSSARSGRW